MIAKGRKGEDGEETDVDNGSTKPDKSPISTPSDNKISETEIKTSKSTMLIWLMLLPKVVVAKALYCHQKEKLDEARIDTGLYCHGAKLRKTSNRKCYFDAKHSKGKQGQGRRQEEEVKGS